MLLLAFSLHVKNSGVIKTKKKFFLAKGVLFYPYLNNSNLILLLRSNKCYKKLYVYYMQKYIKYFYFDIRCYIALFSIYYVYFKYSNFLLIFKHCVQNQ